MNFSDDYYGTAEYAQMRDIQNMLRDEFRATPQLAGQVQQALVKKLDDGIERITREQAAAAAAGAQATMETVHELQYLRQVSAQQTEELSEAMHGVGSAVRESGWRITRSIDESARYLGRIMTKVNWNLEQLNETTQDILKALNEPLDIESKGFFNQGKENFEKNDIPNARERFEQALKANTTNFFAYEYLGFIGVEMNDVAFAMHNFSQAVKYANSCHHRATALSHYARCFFAKGEAVEAEVQQEKATIESPQESWLWYELACYRAFLGKSQPTTTALRKAIELDWKQWAWASQDRNFDRVRAAVSALLAEMKREARERALAALSEYGQALKTSAFIGIVPNTETAKHCGRLLEEDNVYAYLNARQTAETSREAVFKEMERWLDERMEQERQHIHVLNSEKQGALQSCSREVEEDIRADKEDASQEKESLQSLFKNRTSNISAPGFILACGIPAVAGIVVIIKVITKLEWGDGLLTSIFKSPLFLIIYVPLVFIAAVIVFFPLCGIALLVERVYKALSLPKVTRREAEIDSDMVSQIDMTRYLGEKKAATIEAEYSSKIAAAETELGLLRAAKAKIENREYVLSRPQLTE